jgi:hypothetical protein
MAFRADIDVKVGLDGSGLESFATGTFDNGLAEFWMNALFHDFYLSMDAARIPAVGLDTYATPESVVAERFYNIQSVLSIVIAAI